MKTNRRPQVLSPKTAYKVCGRKCRYDTLEQAQATVVRRVREGEGRLSACPCHICGGWHLSSESRSPARRVTTRGELRLGPPVQEEPPIGMFRLGDLIKQ